MRLRTIAFLFYSQKPHRRCFKSLFLTAGLLFISSLFVLNQDPMALASLSFGSVGNSEEGTLPLLTFTRKVWTQSSAEKLDRYLAGVSRWPSWFHNLDQAILIPKDTSKDRFCDLETGDYIQLILKPKGLFKKRPSFLTLKVLSYRPSQHLILEVIQDSSGQLPLLFRDLIWEIQIVPLDSGCELIGKAQAKAQHWRSRFFGWISEKLLMNQIFYPDLIQLARIKTPFTLQPFFPEALTGGFLSPPQDDP